jgi:hypothetical protein
MARLVRSVSKIAVRIVVIKVINIIFVFLRVILFTGNIYIMVIMVIFVCMVFMIIIVLMVITVIFVNMVKL